jgi:hypothetical protein
MLLGKAMTMLLVIVSASAIYVAADSKRYPTGEITQKIFLVGDNASVMESGFGFIPEEIGGGWNVSVELENIARSIPEGTFGDQLSSIRTQLYTSLSVAMARYQGPLPSVPKNKTTFFFAKRIDGRTYPAFQVFPVIKTPLGTNIVQFQDAKIYINGAKQPITNASVLPPECEMKASDAEILGAKSLDAISDIFHRVAAQSEICSQQIGDPIRVAVIDDSGVRWLNK